MQFMRTFLILCITLFTAYSDTLTVDVAEFPPFIIYNDSGTIEGLSVDMWNQIASENDFTFKFNKVDVFSDIFTNLVADESDIGLAGISITGSREEKIDFAHSHITTGIGIMTQKDTNKVKTIILSNIKFYWTLALKLLPFLFGWIAYVYIFGLILWRLELGNDMFNDKFKHGLPDALFFVNVVISSTGFGNQVPLSKWGRRFTIILMYSGIGFMFPLVTGKVASEMTKKAPYVYINSVEDLRNKRVAVIENSTSLGLVKEAGAVPVEVKSLNEARLYLKAGDCEAVVYDKPSLQYIAQKDEHLSVVEETFNVENYGIAVQEGSPYLEKINRSILKLQENGMMKTLQNKWL